MSEEPEIKTTENLKQEEIKEKNYPRFKREHKRNKNLAIWFFEFC